MVGSVVFISYSHDSDLQRKRVLGLSERLRRDGFDTRLDQYVNGSPPEGWPRWMLDRLDEADWVLVVCTETYYQRFRGHGPADVGRGVDYEGLNITQELYDSHNTNTKFIPVLFESNNRQYVPEPLRPHSTCTLTSEADYASLVARLQRVYGFEPGPIIEAPAVGRPTAEPIRFDANMVFRSPDFNVEQADAKKLHELLMKAYPKKPRISELLEQTRIRDSDISTDGTVTQVWLAVLTYAARAGLLRDLVETAADDPTVADYHPLLRQLLDGGVGPDGEAKQGDESLLREVDVLLGNVGRSRSPIIVAIELDDEPLTEFELARTACHLTVTVTAAQVLSLERIAGEAFAGAESIAEIVKAGQQVWQELTAAEHRLTTLHARIVGKGVGQPVSWCARAELLARLTPALQIAHVGTRVARGFVSVGAGGHYVTPLRDAQQEGGVRTMKHRANAAELSVGLVDLRESTAEVSRTMLTAADQDILVAVQHADRPILADIDAVVRGDEVRSTRAVIAFCGPVSVAEIDSLLGVVPFVACADVALAQPMLDALGTALRRYAEDVAMPCIVAAVRAAWVALAVERDDAAACKLGLAWSAWSWVGLPLFSPGYGEVEPALYPHLNDLRSVASREWYYDRTQRIDEPYQASELARATSAPSERFHLYLSGAGGTGKSCFLHHVYDELDARPSNIAVWYRVDAPSSSWENVEARLREETVKAVAEKLDRTTAEAIAQLPSNLAEFLLEAAKSLREQDGEFDEITVFIDQLERTFESGDEPDSHRLETISSALIRLLDRVGIGNGARVFVASRKQYLPDFLVSYRAAQACRLEFNVLQAISDENERTAFIDRIVTWCSKHQLVAPSVRMSTEATKALIGHLDGNPLNMMLALIYLLSQHPTGVIAHDDVVHYEPWNRLFLLDLAAAERDELDWHFLLAMSHARSEIVRFEEVWWRIRMVSPALTRRVDDLRRRGVIERMWLLGFLGRTIHARPLGDEPVRFLEFFHANLRDYLLRGVLAHGRSSGGVGGRYGGTPPAWRALDRLAGFAHDWAQSLQPLLAEEIRVLMEHRKEVVQAGLVPDEAETLPFHLLFLRDRSSARTELCEAAMACFAYSALVHDEQGSWTIEALFPDISSRVANCEDWLRRCPAELRPPILRYVIALESSAARELLVAMLVDATPALRDETAQAAAFVLTEPMYAARFRNEVLLLVLSAALQRVGGDPTRLAKHVAALMVSASGHSRETLLSVINYCVDRLSTSEDANLRALAPGLREFDALDSWFGAADARPFLSHPTIAEPGRSQRAPVELVLGSILRPAVSDTQLAVWSETLRERLCVPLTNLVVVDGDVEPDEAELRFHGRRVSRCAFRPDRLRVSKRLWELSGGGRSGDVFQAAEGSEDVLWLAPEVVSEANYRFASPGFEDALLQWLESRCRNSFDLLFDVGLQLTFIREVVGTPDGRSRLQRIGPHLRPVLVSLVEEGVPLGSRDDLLQQVADLAQRVQQTDQIVQRIREHLRASICRSVTDTSGQVTTVLLADRLEQGLGDRVAGDRLDVTPDEAIRLDEAIRRLVIRNAETVAGPPLIVVTIPRLRHALARLLHQFDHHLPVLSFTELEEDVIAVPGGLVDLELDHRDET